MNLVEVKDFSFSYPECSHKVLEHVNLKIKEGTLNVVCGRSGCGKSTLLRQLKTVLAPAGNTSGQILYRGVSLKDTDHRTQSQEIGFVMQNPDNQIVTDKVWHELAFGLESLGCDNATIRLRVAEMASYFGIQQWFYKNVAELSGGQKRRVAIAGVLAMQPEVLILDEPAAGLDPGSRKEILDTIVHLYRETGMTVILSSHSMEDMAEYAERLLVMNQGELVMDGLPHEIFGRYKELEKMGLSAPKMTYLMHSLAGKGYDLSTDILTVSDAAEEILNLWRKTRMEDGEK